MSKQYNIRWTPADDEALRKAVKNFNAKIARLEKKDPKNKSALPDRVTVRQMRDLITTRQDLNREINSLQRFTRRGAEELVSIPGNEYNLKTTKWQKEEMSRRVGVINRKRTMRRKKLEEIEMQAGGENLGYTVGQFGMGQADKVALEPMKPFSAKMNMADLKMKWKHIQKESQSGYWNWRDELMRDNFIKTLKQNFQKINVSDLILRIESMPFDDFYVKFKSSPGIWEHAYPLTEEEERAYADELRSHWMPNS